jgi:hypothetical protein
MVRIETLSSKTNLLLVVKEVSFICPVNSYNVLHIW